MAYAAGFHVMAKPMGPVCNLQCKYCFYLEKNNLFSKNDLFKMSEEVLEAYISQYVLQDVPEISFVWQGGEPLLAGLPFYKKALELQKQYAGRKSIRNSIQTNGTLLTEQWCEFLKRNQFTVGVSLDGPAFLHDRYRVDTHGNGTFQPVIAAIERLNHWGIPYNVLTCVSRESCRHGKEIYQMFRSLGVTHMQFTPLIERLPGETAKELGLHYEQPDSPEKQIGDWRVTEFSVDPISYGDFLIEVFEEWLKADVGKVFLHNVEDIFPIWLGLPPVMCVYTQQCGNCMIVEHNGDVYSCDHFMYPAYRLGSIQRDTLQQMAKSAVQQRFGLRKQLLPPGCQMCEALPVCGGGCPKHRFVLQGGNQVPTHYLCAGYLKFYRHIARYMKAMAQLMNHGLPPSEVMRLKSGPLMFIKEGK